MCLVELGTACEYCMIKRKMYLQIPWAMSWNATQKAAKEESDD